MITWITSLECLPWLVRGLLWLAIFTACALILRRRIRKWKQGDYCDCCDGSCGKCGGGRACRDYGVYGGRQSDEPGESS